MDHNRDRDDFFYKEADGEIEMKRGEMEMDEREKTK